MLLSVQVDASGRPASIVVIHSLGLGLDERAIDAVAQWKFHPGTKDGKPVAAPVQVEVDFTPL